ncbi:MAG: PAS domain S-box protein, partial [Mariprofundaceae bacterium]|nr:PAS domain S-box protein [Mariprofundaceae bacterium]
MRALRHVFWLPIRLVLPLLLIVISGTVITGFWWFELQRETGDIEQSELTHQTQDMHRLALYLKQGLQSGNTRSLGWQLADFSTEPDMQYAILTDPKGRIHASTRLGWVGRPVESLSENGLLELYSRSLREPHGRVHLSRDRLTVWAHYPVPYPAAKGELRSQRYGILMARFDLSRAKQAARHRIEAWVGVFSAFVATAALLFWLANNLAITRRMQRLIDATGRIRAGDFSARAGLHGRDELAAIGEAFDAMAAQLGQETARLRQLSRAVENMNESVLITDADGSIEYVNEAFCQITGYSIDEVLGENPRLLKSGQHPAEFYAAFWKRISSGKVWKGRMIDRRKDGSLYTAKVSVAPLRDERGQITHYVGVQEDISEQQRLEAQFIQAQKMDSLGTLVGGIAHDFNNMLAGMVGNLYMARKLVRDIPKA